LSILYFLIGKYKKNLTVITHSDSIKEICELMKVSFLHPYFYQKDKEVTAGSCNNYFIKLICSKSLIFLETIRKINQARQMQRSLIPGSTLYYSSFFYDVPGILFLGEVIRSQKLFVRLIRPRNFMAFSKYESPPLLSLTYYLNLITSKLFSFHFDPTFGRVVGINPLFLRKNKIPFFYQKKDFSKNIPYTYVESTILKYAIGSRFKARLLFLGDHSIEQGVSLYGEIYLRILEALSESKNVEIYFKPHPLYHSIKHPVLKRIKIIDTNLPVEFFDDGNWQFIISFVTASFLSLKKSPCVCLTNLSEIEPKNIDLVNFKKKLDSYRDDIIYPSSLNDFISLIENYHKPKN
jgi:hypothetical protein